MRVGFRRPGLRFALRRGFGVAVFVSVAVASLLGILLVSASAGAATARVRALTDMPDDISGPQVHFLYVVPSDGADGQLDSNGGMEQSIARIQNWLVTQTGNQGLRVDTYNGAPDITFVRLPHSDAQATMTNPWPLWVMGEDLVAAGFNDPAKVYAAFYDGHSTWACGGAKSPALPKLGAMYLQAQPTNDPRPCRDAPGFGTGTDRPGYFEIGLLHEVLHTIGFSPPCAPHASASAFPDHVNDSPTDLMYGPDATHTAGWNWSNAVLDFNHDDYYRAHIPACADLSDSPYLTPMFSLSVMANGPGTVTSSPAGIDCPEICAGLFQSAVTMTATPSPGAVFAGWTGVCSGTATCVVTGKGSVTASFRLPCRVPKTVGRGIASAKLTIAKSHCRTGKVGHAYSRKRKKGIVISQSRRPGRVLPAGSKINLTVSRGPRR
jgi:PASTA domain-containing protein